MQDARGDGLEHELLPAHHHGVPGIVAALVADDHAHAGREHVHDLALALVAPLRAHHHDVRHSSVSKSREVRPRVREQLRHVDASAPPRRRPRSSTRTRSASVPSVPMIERPARRAARARRPATRSSGRLMMSRATAAPASRRRRESASARVFSGVKSMTKKSGPGQPRLRALRVHRQERPPDLEGEAGGRAIVAEPRPASGRSAHPPPAGRPGPRRRLRSVRPSSSRSHAPRRGRAAPSRRARRRAAAGTPRPGWRARPPSARS